MTAEKEKIILFGASQQGKTAYENLQGIYHIIAYSDNDRKKWGTSFMGCTVIPPEEVKNYDSVKVIITSCYYRAISKQLIDMGIENIKIFVRKEQLFGTWDEEATFDLLDVKSHDLFTQVNLDFETARSVAEDFSRNYVSEEKKKVLFVAYFFPPIGGSGVQRSVKFVKYLRDFGYEPVVLTVGNKFNPHDIDRKMLNDIPDDVEIIRIDDNFLLTEQLTQRQQQEILNLYYGIMQSPVWLEEYIRVINENVEEINHELIPDENIYWVNEVLKKIESRIDLSKIELIFTSGSPYSLYFLGYYIKKKYHIPWVMDDRDAWTANTSIAEMQWWFNGYEGTYDLEVELNQKMLLDIDWLVVISNQVKYDYIDKFLVDEKKISVITNGYDEEDFQEIQNSKSVKFQLCYNGWVYLDRNPIPVLELINELIDSQYMKKEDVEWIFNGVVQREMKEQLEAGDKHHILRFNGYLEHIESLRIASQSNVLILFGGVGEASKTMYTGKIFEYLRLQIPILGLSSSGGVFDEVFEKTQCGRNYEYEDLEGIREYLLGLYNEWKSGDCAVQVREQEIMKFERKYLTKQLANIFDEVICR